MSLQRVNSVTLKGKGKARIRYLTCPAALYNLGSGSWSARANGAAAQMRPSIASAIGNRQAHRRPNQPHQAFTL